MSTPEDLQDSALKDLLARLIDRVEKIEERLTHIEKSAPATAVPQDLPWINRQAPARQTAPSDKPTGGQPAAPPSETPSQILPEMPSSARDRQPPKPVADLETRLGLTWINRIGVVTLVIGIGFFFKYAVDNQWVGETGRVILGILTGLATLAAGDILFRRSQKVFAQGICSLGLSILYLSFYASFAFYHLLPQPAAFLLMALTSATAGALALRYDAIAIAGLTMLGGYLTPVLLSTGHDAPWTFFGYVFLIDLAAFLIAKVRRWWALHAIAFVATVMLYASWYGTWFKTEKQLVATVALLAFYALFTFVEWPAILYFTILLAGFALVGILQNIVAYLVLSLALGAAGLALADRKKLPAAATLSFTVFWAAYGLWRLAGTAVVENVGFVFLLLTLAFALFLAWVPFQILIRRGVVQTQHLALIALNGAVYFAFSYRLLAPHYRPWLGLFAASVAGVHLWLGMELWKRQAAAGRDTRPVLLTLGIASGFLTLAVPIQFTGFRITLFWALEAAILVWIGRRMNERRVLFGALAIYLFTLLRLCFLDSQMPDAQLTLLFNARFVTFTVSAVSLWLGAWWMKAIVRELAATAYIFGHIVFLSAFLLELNGWINRTANPEDQGSLLAIGFSILLATYAVLLIGKGVWRRNALDRSLGVALIGIVVLKLYLHDVWELSRLFRMAAFVALGILLLLASYLYTRLRPVVQSWLVEKE